MQEVQTHITNFQVLRPVSLAVPVQKEILLQALAISLKMERENSALIEPAELPPPSDWWGQISSTAQSEHTSVLNTLDLSYALLNS